MLRYFHRGILVWLCLSAGLALAGAPAVFRTEPPNWWVGHSHNPVRVLFTGTNLTGANIAATDGLAISNVAVSATGEFCLRGCVHRAAGPTRRARVAIGNSARPRHGFI
jgi:hypothetical protein